MFVFDFMKSVSASHGVKVREPQETTFCIILPKLTMCHKGKNELSNLLKFAAVLHLLKELISNFCNMTSHLAISSVFTHL